MTIDPKTNKIQAIKALRQWTLEVFGVQAGLRESKNYVDFIIAARDKDIERSNRVRMILLDVPFPMRQDLYFYLAEKMGVSYFVGIGLSYLDNYYLQNPIV